LKLPDPNIEYKANTGWPDKNGFVPENRHKKGFEKLAKGIIFMLDWIGLFAALINCCFWY
jgi:hypothetical protein